MFVETTHQGSGEHYSIAQPCSFATASMNASGKDGASRNFSTERQVVAMIQAAEQPEPRLICSFSYEPVCSASATVAVAASWSATAKGRVEGLGSGVVDERVLWSAQKWIGELDAHLVASGQPLPSAAPHVALGPFGEVVLEWWGVSKKLTIYIGPEENECIKVWGPSVATEMSEEVLPSAAAAAAALEWLRMV